MPAVVFWTNMVLFIAFSLLYLYQFGYIVISLSKKKPSSDSNTEIHRFAVLIAARNESEVIGELLSSIYDQDYPMEFVDVFVVADNCTDDTAAIAASYGARVFEREDQELVGKSYALDYALKSLFANKDEYGEYDGFFVFDADNILDPHFITAMNEEFSNGWDAVTSYRNSKNYGSSWVSAGCALWFLRESKWLSKARNLLGNSCLIGGTGFLISSKILENNGGWVHHLMTEDIEFSVDFITHGHKIGYSENAIVYDEQPVTLKQSWTQRMRWSKGFYQVLTNYWKPMVSNAFVKRDFSSYDAFCTVAPALLVTIASILFNVMSIGITAIVDPVFTGSVFYACMMSLYCCLVNFYIAMFFFGLITTISEWDVIYAPEYKKILYIFTFPLFMITYLPIAVQALCGKVEWKPIAHSFSCDIQDIKNAGRRCAAPIKEHGR